MIKGGPGNDTVNESTPDGERDTIDLGTGMDSVNSSNGEEEDVELGDDDNSDSGTVDPEDTLTNQNGEDSGITRVSGGP